MLISYKQASKLPCAIFLCYICVRSVSKLQFTRQLIGIRDIAYGAYVPG